MSLRFPVDCQQLKRTGARSAGLQWLHSNCLRGQHDDVGGTCHANVDVGGEIATTGRVARIWEEDDSVSAWIVRQEDRPLHHLQQQLRVWHVHVERTRNRAAKCSRKWMGASRLDLAEPHGSSPGWQLSWLHAGRSCCWRPTWDWKRSMYVEAQHWAGNGWPKVNGGHATGACWAPWAVQRDRCLHCTLLPQQPRGRHRGRQHARIILILAWWHWTESRWSRKDLPGPHQAV